MTPTVNVVAPTSDARRLAERAATTAGVTITEVDDIAGHQAIAALFRAVWRAPDGSEVLPASEIRMLSSIGSYVVAASAGDMLLGASIGVFAADGHLHSHVTGVAAAGQGRGIGRALKLHQRVWALERGITRISWTFDPLVLRNAWFNLHALGAEAVAYHPDFYGPMADGVNAGDASDRLLVEWPLDEPRVEAALAGSHRGPPPAGERRVALPPDIERLRATDPAAARRWRRDVRDQLTAAFADGLAIVAVDRAGAYVLDRRRQ